MREILFRGKMKDNGEWVYGDLINDGTGIISILPQCPDGEFITVIPKTVGQYTGVDVDGVKIFEGDIALLRKGVEYESNDTNLFKPLVVDYCLDFAEFEVLRPIDISSTDKEQWVYGGVPACVADIEKIIGNIHDNPELLEVNND